MFSVLRPLFFPRLCLCLCACVSSSCAFRFVQFHATEAVGFACFLRIVIQCGSCCSWSVLRWLMCSLFLTVDRQSSRSRSRSRGRCRRRPSWRRRRRRRRPHPQVYVKLNDPCLFVCLSLSFSVCLSVCLSLSLNRSPSFFIYVFLSFNPLAQPSTRNPKCCLRRLTK